MKTNSFALRGRPKRLKFVFEGKMGLVMYSGGRFRSNEVLHDALSQMVGEKRKKFFTYVPFCADGSQRFYERAIARYQKFGFSDFQCLPLDRGYSEEKVKRALDGDVIYLAGGNTFYFLKYLRETGLMPRLRKFSKQGGVIAGLSAGAVILTPHIGLAGYPDFDADDNDVKLNNLTALKLVNFEFYPHYVNTRKISDALSSYSAQSKYPVFSVGDGGGLIIEPNRTCFYGDVFLFQNGDKTKISL